MVECFIPTFSSSYNQVSLQPFTTTRFAVGEQIYLWVFTEGNSIPHALMMYDGNSHVDITLITYSKARHGGSWALRDLTLCMFMVGMSAIEFVLSVCHVQRLWIYIQFHLWSPKI